MCGLCFGGFGLGVFILFGCMVSGFCVGFRGVDWFFCPVCGGRVVEDLGGGVWFCSVCGLVVFECGCLLFDVD